MREYNYVVQYVQGKDNHVTDNLLRSMRVIQRPQEPIWLGKTKEEMRTLQLEEYKWKEMIEYLEDGGIPRKRFPRCTLNQISLWDDIQYYTVTRKDGSEQFCLVVSESLKQSALHHAHVQSGHLGQKKTYHCRVTIFLV